MSVLRVGTVSPVPSFDPREAMADAPAQIADLVFESPFRMRFGSESPSAVLTDVCEGDPVRLRVREGVRFSDGRPLTPAILAACLGEGPPLGDGDWIGVEGDDVVVRTPDTAARTAVRLSEATHAIVLRGQDDDRFVGTGPYCIAKDSTSERVRLVRNPHARERPHFEEIHFIAFGDVEALREAVQKNEIDLTVSLPTDEAEGLGTAVVEVADEASTAILFFNCRRHVLRDPAIRRALAMAIDRDEVTRAAHERGAPVASGLLPAAMHSHPGARVDKWPPYDPEAARSTISSAGLADFHIDLVLPWAPRGYVGDPWSAGETIAAQLAAIGVLVDLVPTTTPRHAIDLAVAGDYDLFLAGWSCDTPDPADFLDALLHSSAIPGSASAGDRGPTAPARPMALSCNLGRVRSAEIDRHLAQYRREPSDYHLEMLHDRLALEMPLLPICHGVTTLVHQKDIHGIEVVGPRLLDYRSMRR